jgi:signal peptidase I
MTRFPMRRPIVVAGELIAILGVCMVGVLLLQSGNHSLPQISDAMNRMRSVRVTGTAMSPTLHDGQQVTVDTHAYRDLSPERGDIVLIATPSHQSVFFRVIAVPGDRVMIRSGQVLLNGAVLREPYVRDLWTINTFWPAGGRQVTIPPDHYFVLGDNRDQAKDSRTNGFVPISAIEGELQP